jgi:SpoVK/Ycf46/Vps4 family AAA+-type ATPase
MFVFEKKDYDGNSYLKKPYTKKISINGEDCELIYMDAPYMVIGDEDILLDQITLDFMFEEVAQGIKNNTSKHTITPKSIIISKDTFEDVITSLAGNSSNDDLEKNNELVKSEEKQLKQEKISLDKNGSPKETIEDNKDQEEKEDDSITTAQANQENFFRRLSPKHKFDDVYVDAESKSTILSALIMAKQRDKLYTEWGLGTTLKTGRSLVLNFYGPPGTGKTMLAEAIANYLIKDLFIVNYSELESGNPGDTAKNLVKVFKLAKNSNSVLLFDEADSFLSKRLSSVANAADAAINITRSVMLIEIEKFDGVIIFTTNFISNYDIAFKRRILASVEFKLPDEKGRVHIWRSHIPEELPLTRGITAESLAYRYGGTSGADIKDLILFASVNCLERGRERLSWEDFEDAYKAVKNRYSIV